MLISVIISVVYATGDVKEMFDYDGVLLGERCQSRCIYQIIINPDAYIRSLLQKIVLYT